MKTAVFHYALSALLLLVYLPIPLTATTQADEPDIAAWLAEHPLVSETIRWQDSNGTRAYPNWSGTQKADLYETYQAVWSGQSLELTDPPPNVRRFADDQSVVTVLSKDHAWSLFLAHVAYSLAVEAGRWVPWSLTEYSREELLELFDGSRTFRRTSGGYQLIHRAVPAPPDATFEFLNANLMIGQDRLHTIENLLEWSRDHLIHFLGDFRAKNVEGHWQYRGEMPVSRVISGTMAIAYLRGKGDYSPPPEELPFGHYTAGCWGTTAFLRAVLRVVNIPVQNAPAGGHALPYFMTEGRYLSHGDDPYDGNTRSSPGFPIEELFIDQATYDAWFRSSVPPVNNVGHQTAELAIKYLPLALLRMHCNYVRYVGNGKTHADAYADNYLGLLRYYSVEELEAIDLWGIIEAKIKSLGGCPIQISWVVYEPRTPTIVKISGSITASESRLVVAVKDSEGQPIEGHLVTFTVTSGDGTLSAIRTTTNADGRAESRLTLGPDAGTNSVSAFAAGVEQPVIFTAAGQEITAVEPETPQTLTLTKVSGDEQQGPASAQLAEPFVVSVLDQDGSPLAGVDVTFAVTAGGGMLSAPTNANPCTITSSTSSTTVTTNANGQASARLTLGSESGTNTVEATVEGQEPETFTATGAEQARPHRLTKVCGDDQENTVGILLATPFVVLVSDENGAAMAGVVVSFAVTAGGGTLSAATATTDANGRAATRLTLGSQPGTNTVSATVAGLEPVTFTATGQEDPFISLFDAFLGGGKRVALPDSPQLAQNAPNPFNSQTFLSYFLPAPGPARLAVFTLTGQRVAVLRQGPQQAGYHRLHWNGRDDAGRPLASGMYLYRLVTEEDVLTRKLILLR